jgi:hypothetical protein
LATRTIRQWDNLIELANVLITSWVVYEGCSEDVIAKGREIQNDFNPMEKVGNAIEMAIISDAKLFVKSPPCQKVIDAIWSGKIVYTAESSRSLLRDAYKRSPIHYYDPVSNTRLIGLLPLVLTFSSAKLRSWIITGMPKAVG